jgi:uncharacterized protein (UPF0335 family)
LGKKHFINNFKKNMTDITNKETAEQLRRYIESIEANEAEKKELTERIAEVYAEAKAVGFDVATIKQIIKIRKIDKEKLLEAEYLLETYLEALDGK